MSVPLAIADVSTVESVIVVDVFSRTVVPAGIPAPLTESPTATALALLNVSRFVLIAAVAVVVSGKAFVTTP